MKRILITGASGYLGARVLNLLRLKHEVCAVVRRREGPPLENVTYFEIDLSRSWSQQELPASVDGVVHLAQARDYRRFPGKAAEIFGVNLASTASLLDYAHRAGAQSFILASTGGVYGSIKGKITGATPANPPDGELGYYFRTKLAAEMLAHAYANFMRVSILRPFFIYGPGQPEDRLVGKIIELVRSGREVQLDGEDGMCLNPIYVDDAAELVGVLVDRGGPEILNVAGPDAVTIKYIAETAGSHLDAKPQFNTTLRESGRLVADHLPVAELLGRQLVGFDDGLARVIGHEDGERNARNLEGL